MTEEQSVIKTAQDLAIEELQKRLTGMEETYQARIKELEDANKGLWASAHKAPAAEITESESAPTFDFDKAEEAFYTALGRKKEE